MNPFKGFFVTSNDRGRKGHGLNHLFFFPEGFEDFVFFLLNDQRNTLLFWKIVVK